MRYIVKPLTRDKLRKKAVFFDKLIVFAVFDYLSVVKDDDSVALLYGGQTMGNYEPRAFKRVTRLGYFFCVRLSSALVASSSISIFGFGAIARAIISL